VGGCNACGSAAAGVTTFATIYLATTEELKGATTRDIAERTEMLDGLLACGVLFAGDDAAFYTEKILFL
jgi:hypothetical protein